MAEDQLIENNSWAVVEVLGHNVFAGRISEHVIGGTGFIRVDVPELPEERQKQYGREYIQPRIPAFTKLIGTGSIYAITPCSEDVAKKVASDKRAIPVNVIDLQDHSRPLIESSRPDNDEDDGDRNDQGACF